MLDWIVENEAWEWIFSGIGVVIATTVISILWRFLRRQQSPPESSSNITIGDVKGGIHDSTIAGRDAHVHGDQVRGDRVAGDKVEGDQITVSNVSGTAIAIGQDAIATVYQLEEKPSLYVGVPSMPNHFVGRDALVEQLVEGLLSGQQAAISAFEGLPGVGKTSLAVAIAHHKRILEHFRDGVLWAGLGPQPNVVSILARWARALEVDISDLVTPEERAQVVQDTIGQRHLLLVIDDAWDLESTRLLRCGGLNCSYVLTTRNQAIARDFAGMNQIEQVPVLDKAPAHQLLA